MRFSRTLATSATAFGPEPSRLTALPHILAAALLWPALGSAAFLAGTIFACMATFIVYLPLIALALNDWRPITPHDDAPRLTGRAYIALLMLWTATAWGCAFLSIPGR